MKNLIKDKTRCLLVHPKCSSLSYWNYVDVCKIAGAKYPAAPLGLMTAAALLPQHWEFKLIDTNVEPLRDEHLEWAEIVCTGGMLPQQPNTLAIIDRAKKHHRPVVVGGPDPTSQPELYQSADYLVLGEGEISIPPFLQALGNGQTGGIFFSDEKADMGNAVIPRFDLIRFEDYLQVGIQCTRGCPFNCEFCDVIEIYGRVPRFKTPEQIIAELQSLYDLGYRGHVDFVDDNFIANKINTKKVLRHLKNWLEINNHPFFFTTEASINLADDENLMQLMKDVDFRFVFVGIESPEDEILKSTQKKLNVNKNVKETVRKINSFGMIVNAGFIIGFDNESDRSSDFMEKCIQDSGICMAMVGKLYALPNTQLTKRLRDEGRLFEKDAILRDVNTDIDQTTSGLNFLTARPRVDVLKDYVHVLKYIYEPKQYYDRIIQTGLNLRPDYKYKPSFKKLLKSIKVFFILGGKIGLNRYTGWLYWKLLAIIIIKNPGAIEAVINLAAMFIHFHKHSGFVIDLTTKEINELESLNSKTYDRLIPDEEPDSYIYNSSMPAVEKKISNM